MASIRVLGVHSSKTVSAIRRIADILKPAGIHIVNGQLQHANDYDYILANNIGVPSRYRHKTILYLCSAATSQFMRFHTREDLRNNPYKAIWVNCNSGRLLLEKKGVESELMYRPNKLHFQRDTILLRAPRSCYSTGRHEKIILTTNIGISVNVFCWIRTV